MQAAAAAAAQSTLAVGVAGSAIEANAAQLRPKMLKALPTWPEIQVQTAKAEPAAEGGIIQFYIEYIFTCLYADILVSEGAANLHRRGATKRHKKRQVGRLRPGDHKWYTVLYIRY